jgi:hypothetical protein
MKPYYDQAPHRCRITEQGFNEASTGTEQFWIKFLVLMRIEPFNDSLEKYSRVAYFPITAKTADWVMQYLHTLGFKGDNFDGVDPHVEGHHSFVGNEIELVCSHVDDQNKTPREKWGPRATGPSARWGKSAQAESASHKKAAIGKWSNCAGNRQYPNYR